MNFIYIPSSFIFIYYTYNIMYIKILRSDTKPTKNKVNTNEKN